MKPDTVQVNDLEALAGKLERVVERTTGDRFENAVREFGVVNACEWFGHAADSEFTKETVRLLIERAKAQPSPTAEPLSDAVRRHLMQRTGSTSP